jgi:RNA recognition motif-containing protein
VKNLYVGNLAYSVTADDLRGLFAEAGVVSEATIGLADSVQMARGFGYVVMETEEQAAKAIALLNGRELQGRRLNVKYPHDEADRPRGFRMGVGPRRTAR